MGLNGENYSCKILTQTLMLGLKIFLSYANQDGAYTVKRLQRDLNAAGRPVWIGVESAPSSTETVEQAIAGADLFLGVIT